MKKILIAASLSMSSVSIFASGDPVAAGDVLGRNLSVIGLGSLGHIGVLASTDNVVQVMNASSYVNVIQNVSVAEFKVNTYWGAKAKPNFT